MDPAKLEQMLLAPGATVRSAIECIDAGAIEIALLVDEQRRLLGTVTDGDVRRALLAGATLEDPIDGIAHYDSIAAQGDTPDGELLALMTEGGVDQVPLLDGGRVVDIAFLRDLVASSDATMETADHPVVLMAGGSGIRLRPLTEKTPKPMLPVGDRPLLETVL